MNTHSKILLVGAGQLGSRHLQGLARINIPVSIQVVDPNTDSLQIARERFAETGTNPNIRKISFTTAADMTEEPIDLAIIATGSDVRANVLSSLISTHQVRNVILEKFLFQSESDFHGSADVLTRQTVSAVVNCPRRIYPFYRQLKETLAGQRPINFRVAGSNWGLACNVIHFLDLFAFLSGNSLLEIDSSGLDNQILESKRPGYVEFTGTVSGKNACNDQFEITSNQEPGIPLVINITAGNVDVVISETVGKVTFSGETIKAGQEESFVVPYQSQLTGVIAEELLTTGICGLTSYQESMALHLPVLRAFLHHLNKTSDRQYTCCPIT